MTHTISALYCYPVKSLKAVGLENMAIDSFGPLWDRRFMLVDGDGQFITQRRYPVLSQVSAGFDGQVLSVSGIDMPPLDVDLEEFEGLTEVEVWRDRVTADVCRNKKINAMFSDLLGIEVRLVFMPESSFRQIDPEYCAERRRVGFADGFSFLLTNQASLNDLNSRLPAPIPMSRFRPNIVFEGDRPYQEDDWKRIRIGSVEFDVVKPCSRCVMTTIDQNGIAGKEPLKTLSSYRRNAYGVCFGQNLVHRREGRVSVSDVLEVLE